MTQYEIILADSIIRDAVNIFPRFKNRSGYSTYNFWRTDTFSTFPFYWWMRFFRKNSLPDDPDCTAVCWSVSGGPPEYLQRTHEELQLAAVKKVQDKTRSLSTYSIFPAYACWMGNDYPPVTDICTLCNILSFVQIYHLPWSATDTASLDLILAIIRNEDHLEKPEIVSPYYGQPAFILYQLAGLMQVQPIEKLEAMKEKLVADAFRLWTRSKDPLERTVLSTALIKWGVSSKMLAGEATSLRIEKTRWSLMTANGKATAGFFAKLLMGMGKIGKFDYYCPAYNKVLLLENLILRRSNLSERDPSVN